MMGQVLPPVTSLQKRMLMTFSNALVDLFAEITQSNLKKQIQFLKAENQILRGHCAKQRIILSRRDKNKLLKFGLPLGAEVRRLISVVTYSTFRKWVRQEENPVVQRPKRRGRPPKITLAIKHLIVRMAKKNKWGYSKIIGELKKLCIIKTSKTTVKNILREYGIDPLKYRSEDTWDRYLKRTFETLWACDFFSKTVWTPWGRRLYYALFFINIKTRKVHIAGITRRPNNAWVMRSLKEMRTVFEQHGGKTALVRDRDCKFSKEFDAFFAENNFSVLRIPFRSPNLNPYAESWVATVKRECLDHFLVLGKGHLEYLITEFVRYYNHYRPHSGMDNLVLDTVPSQSDGAVYEKSILGGLVRHYYRK